MSFPSSSAVRCRSHEICQPMLGVTVPLLIHDMQIYSAAFCIILLCCTMRFMRFVIASTLADSIFDPHLCECAS